MKVSTLLGFRPHDAVMSMNEMMWWQAYSCCRPLEPDRLDLMEASILNCWSNNPNPNTLLRKWFRPEDDPEYAKLKDQQVKERLRKRREALKKKMAEEEAAKNG